MTSHDGVGRLIFLLNSVSAKRFEYDNLLIHYFVELPRGWYCSTGPNGLWGMTQTCKTADIDKVSLTLPTPALSSMSALSGRRRLFLMPF